MKLIILITIITIISILVHILSGKWCSSYSDVPFFTGIIMWISIIAIVTSVIAIPICKYDTRLMIEEFISAKNTIQCQKENATDLEKVQISKTIIEYNTWLSKEKYSCESEWVSAYSDKTVLELTPIE